MLKHKDGKEKGKRRKTALSLRIILNYTDILNLQTILSKTSHMQQIYTQPKKRETAEKKMHEMFRIRKPMHLPRECK